MGFLSWREQRGRAASQETPLLSGFLRLGKTVGAWPMLDTAMHVKTLPISGSYTGPPVASAGYPLPSDSGRS